MTSGRRSPALGVCAAVCALAGVCSGSAPVRAPHPLFFERNLGQAAPHDLFLARDGGVTIAFERSRLDFRSGPGAGVTLEFAGASRSARLEGDRLQPGRVSYFLGRDSSHWITGIPAYAGVFYRGLYPGIDIHFYRGSSGLEYDLVLAPGADLRRVRLRFRGVRRVFLDPRGDLHAVTAAGEIVQPRPAIAGGFEARYFIDSHGDAGFTVDPDPRGRSLTIDPQLIYATYFGGAGDDAPVAVRASASGEIYVLGSTTPAGGGSADVFALELASTGQLEYKVYLGGSKIDLPQALAIGADGGAVATGYTESADFPTLHAFQSQYAGAGDSFVFKLDAEGNLVFSTYLGGSKPMPCGCVMAYNSGRGIDVDGAGDIYVGGETAASDFPVTVSLPNRVPDGGDGYLVKFSPAGAFLFGALAGGSAYDGIHAVAFDSTSSGAVYVTGDTLSSDLPMVGLPFQSKHGGGVEFGDTWVGRIDTTAGSAFLTASTYFGGSADDEPFSIAVDPEHNVIVAGATLSADLPVSANATQEIFGGGTAQGDGQGDGFVARFDSSLSHLLFGTYLGGPGQDYAQQALADRFGDIWVVGEAGAPFPAIAPTADALQPSFSGITSGYLLKLDPAFGSVLYFSYAGGSGRDYTAGVDLDSSGRVYSVSSSTSTDLSTKNPFQNAPGGGIDSFIRSLDLSGAPVIDSVNVAWGGAAIAPNAWIEIHGRNLSTRDRIWQASDFAAGEMPSSIDQVRATVNGKAAYVYYASSNQVNVLTPVDAATGPVEVRLWSRLGSSQPFRAEMQSVAPALARSGNYVVALHADGSEVTAQSPAHANESIVLLAFGLGLPSTALKDGVAAQTGSLPSLPAVSIGGVRAQVASAGLGGPGLYRVMITVPSAAISGDNSVTLDYAGVAASGGPAIPVQ